MLDTRFKFVETTITCTHKLTAVTPPVDSLICVADRKNKLNLANLWDRTLQ